MISKLSFIGCGAPVHDEGLTRVGILTSSVTLFLMNITNVSILYTHVHDSKEASMLAANVFDLILQRTSFIRNTPNCAIVFRDESNTPCKLLVSGYIADSEFGFGVADHKSLSYGGGLSLIFSQTSYTVNVNINNVTLYNNIGMAWCDFVMTIDEWSCNYTMVQAEKIRISNGLTYSGLLGRCPGLSVHGISQNSISLNQENNEP